MADIRPLDRNPYRVNRLEHLHRVLGRPQLTGRSTHTAEYQCAYQHIQALVYLAALVLASSSLPDL